ncbi:MAG: hypothetical protein AAGA68_26920 [Pseudomonadota bacterium]
MAVAVDVADVPRVAPAVEGEDARHLEPVTAMAAVLGEQRRDVDDGGKRIGAGGGGQQQREGGHPVGGGDARVYGRSVSDPGDTGLNTLPAQDDEC